ncbi:MAG: response regulator [Campylobacter sp.]|nr:response regulator [Campylobacter sp.]
MKILIVENEVYLAQSIAAKLASLDHDCEILTNINDVFNFPSPDVVLLSTNMFGENMYEVIKKFSDSIVIMLISYISNDTVSRPLKAGASDYIQKPFMIEELIRKIDHFDEFKKLKRSEQNFRSYLDFTFKNKKDLDFSFKNIKFPLFIKACNQKSIDQFIYEYAKANNFEIKVINLNDENLKILEKTTLPTYILNFESIKEKDLFYDLISDKQVFVNALNFKGELPFDTLNLQKDENFNVINDILTIDEYFKFIILNYQDSFTDTDLAKKLGISRKSLWEKRKRYDIQKHNDN